MKKIYVLTILILFIGLPHLARADEIIFLKDGSLIYGTIRNTNNLYIQIIDKKRKFLQIKRDQVLRVLYNKDKIDISYIYKKDGSMTKGYIVAENAKSITIRKILNKAEEIVIKRDDIASISQKKIESQKMFLFTYNKPASKVEIEGDFTGWKPVLMDPQGKETNKTYQRWTKGIKIDILKKNNYEYRFIINGRAEQKQSITFKMKDGNLAEDIPVLKFSLGLWVGGAMYLGGYGDRLEMRQPVVNLMLKVNFLFLWDPLALQLEVGYGGHAPKSGTNPALTGIDAQTTNIFISIFAALDFYFFDQMGIHPKIGFGYAVQSTTSTGDLSDSFSNAVPFIGLGFGISYVFNSSMRIELTFQDYMEIEGSIVTNLGMLTLGFIYSF